MWLRDLLGEDYPNRCNEQMVKSISLVCCVEILTLDVVTGFQNKFEVRSRKSKKDRQHNDQKKKNKRTNSDIQTITEKKKKIDQHELH